MSVLIPALFGLLGVIIGGIITAGSNYFLDRRRERAAKEREERERAIEIERAARLIDIEMLRAAASITLLIRNKRWPSTKLQTEVWQKYSPVIAPALSYADWLVMVRAVIAIDSIDWNAFPEGQVSEELVEAVVPLSKDIMAGVHVLSPLCRRT